MEIIFFFCFCFFFEVLKTRKNENIGPPCGPGVQLDRQYQIVFLVMGFSSTQIVIERVNIVMWW